MTELPVDTAEGMKVNGSCLDETEQDPRHATGISRWSLPEIEDQPWCPAIIRRYAMDHLRTLFDFVTPYARCASLIEEIMRNANEREVLDLCSGAGGPWPDLAKRLRQRNVSIAVTLTDRFPPHPYVHVASTGITYYRHPVDAAELPLHMPGVVTLFTAFHHFEPVDARRILKRAARGNRYIAIFEATERSFSGLLHVIASLVTIPFLTPFVRPFRISRLILTYVFPLVPLLILIDGVLSVLRSYSERDLEVLAQSVDEPGYTWKSGRLKASLFKPAVTYLIGSPSPGRRCEPSACQGPHRRSESLPTASQPVPQ